ncbi:hypothetical protein [Paenibacillus sp. MMS18-CY102]|uniref:hypothetical protein n=1 Tax=Paenibacillus sp. MMS18-CY102 TaxID=2682849 RepID=UPI001365FA40|nr:hypothetical protein [Paenibacillus sp. MMS18-CY102]MWC29979.1 hypothetical protein [Paenibacillus sp. MMS18-CY102]
MDKRKWIMVTGLCIILLCGIAVGIYTFPRSIDVTLHGVKYQLGTDGAKAGTESATVVIHGVSRMSIWGDRTFKGRVTVVGENIPVPEDQRELEIRFMRDGYGPMTYVYWERVNGHTVGKIYGYHTIFANKDFSEVTLLVLSPVKLANGEEGKSWNGDNGFMITAPTSNREDAVALSNKLMHGYLDHPGMKQLQ